MLVAGNKNKQKDVKINVKITLQYEICIALWYDTHTHAIVAAVNKIVSNFVWPQCIFHGFPSWTLLCNFYLYFFFTKTLDCDRHVDMSNRLQYCKLRHENANGGGHCKCKDTCLPREKSYWCLSIRRCVFFVFVIHVSTATWNSDNNKILLLFVCADAESQSQSNTYCYVWFRHYVLDWASSSSAAAAPPRICRFRIGSFLFSFSFWFVCRAKQSMRRCSDNIFLRIASQGIAQRLTYATMAFIYSRGERRNVLREDTAACVFGVRVCVCVMGSVRDENGKNAPKWEWRVFEFTFNPARAPSSLLTDVAGPWQRFYVMSGMCAVTITRRITLMS